MLCLQVDSQTYIILLISDLQCYKPTFFQQNQFAALQEQIRGTFVQHQQSRP